MITKKLNTNERIRSVKDHFFGTNAEFAKRLDKNPQFISNIMSEGYSVSMRTLREILDVVTEVNDTWLFSGEGSMIKPSKSLTDNLHANRSGVRFYEISNDIYTIEIPLVTKKDYNYFVNECTAKDYRQFEKLKRSFYISRTISNCGYIGLEIQGNGMADRINHGDIVFGRRVDLAKLPLAIFPSFNQYWIVVHNKGVVCRKIDFSEIGKGKLIFKAEQDNIEYPDFTLDMTDILRLYNIEHRNESI